MSKFKKYMMVFFFLLFYIFSVNLLSLLQWVGSCGSNNILWGKESSGNDQILPQVTCSKDKASYTLYRDTFFGKVAISSNDSVLFGGLLKLPRFVLGYSIDFLNKLVVYLSTFFLIVYPVYNFFK